MAETLALAERVTISGSAEIAGLSPRITVRLADGATHQLRAGGREFMLDFAEDGAVIRSLAAEIPGGAATVDRLIAAVDGLDRAPDLGELLAALVV